MRVRVLEFYGYSIEVQWPNEFAFEAFSREFTCFEATSSAKPHLRITVRRERVDLESYPFLKPSFATPRNVCYFHEGKRLIAYHGQGLAIEDKRCGEIEILGLDEQLVQSILYTIIIAKTGAFFDSLSRFRIHGLGFAIDNKAYLVLLPMGGGKSTLLLQLLKDPRVRLISEDTPLIDANGRLWPFPIKIGVLPGGVPSEVPAAMVTRVMHLEGVEKELIDLAYLGERLVREPLPIAGIFVGHRYLGADTEFVPLSYTASLRVAIRDCVVGIGVFQGLEFILSTSTWNLLAKIGLAVRRLFTCAKFFSAAPVYEFRMGARPEQNAVRLLEKISQTQ